MPLDAIGDMYVDLLVSREPLPPMVNVVHPHPTTWEDVLANVRDELGGHIPYVSMDEWIDKLEILSANASNDDLQRIVSLDTDSPRKFPLINV